MTPQEMDRIVQDKKELLAAPYEWSSNLRLVIRAVELQGLELNNKAAARSSFSAFLNTQQRTRMTRGEVALLVGKWFETFRPPLARLADLGDPNG